MMDNSETYLEMYERAWEIQGGWMPHHGDLIQQRHTDLTGETRSHLSPLLVVEGISKSSVLAYFPESWGNKTGLEMVCWRVNNKFFNKNNGYWWWIWLPRQDQLQKLDGRHWREFDQACEYEWSLLPNIEKDISTKEQCGIRVVMRKFNKVWNGEEWVREKQAKTVGMVGIGKVEGGT